MTDYELMHQAAEALEGLQLEWAAQRLTGTLEARHVQPILVQQAVRELRKRLQRGLELTITMEALLKK